MNHKFINKLGGLFLVALLFCVQFILAQVSIKGEGINGTDLMLYHKIVLTVDGPSGSENAATFRNNRMSVEFVNGSTKVLVSGYYAADGNAAVSSGTSGNKWRCNFRPEKTGTWTYTINFHQGTDIFLKVNSDHSGVTAIAPNGTTGSFTVANSNKTGRDFRNPERGPLKYVGKHQYKYAGSDNYFVRAGMGIPEALFSYSDFDNTPSAKPYNAHSAHYDLNPSPELLWNGKGKNMMGVANYTAQQGANTLYGVMFNIGGDGNDSRFPWTTFTGYSVFDVSKLEQWDRVLTHFNNVGVAFVFMFAEHENENFIPSAELRLWYREAAARFGHLAAISFVLCEEMDIEKTAVSVAQANIDFLRAADGHESPIGVHTAGNSSGYVPYYSGELSSHANSTYACVQTKATNFADVYDTTKLIRSYSTGAGKTPWVISIDEARDATNGLPKVDASDPNHDMTRVNALWGNLMGGGMGVSVYTQNGGGDPNLEDFTVFKNLLNQCGSAIDFFWNNKIPLGDMAPTDALVSSGRCISAKGRAYVIHLPTGGSIPTLNLTGVSGKFNVSWLNTKTGAMIAGTTTTVNGGTVVSLGTAPAGLPNDKVILVSAGQATPTYNLTVSATNGSVIPGSGSYAEGSVVQLEAKANLGYKFSSWGGNLSGSVNPTSITMSSNKSVTANFVATPTYTLNVSGTNGSVSFAPMGGTYNEGTEVTLTPTPNAGYKFDSWSGDLVSTEYFPKVTMDANKVITANFSIDTNLIKNGDFRQGTSNWVIRTVGIEPDGGVTVVNGVAYLEVHIDGTTPESIFFEQTSFNLVQGKDYKLNFDSKAEENRNITIRLVSESSTSTSFPDQTKAITTNFSNIEHSWKHTAASGRYKIQFLIAGAGSNDVWMDNVTLMTVSPPVVSYTISASAGANGTISPSGSVAVNSGASQSFSFAPNAGYEVADVIVNGVSQGVLTSYTFSNVTANQSISVSFKQSVIVGDYVRITSPTNGATLAAGTPVTVIAEGFDAQGIATMRFQVDGGTFFNDDVAPYSYTFSNLSVGNHTLVVQMKDNLVNRILSNPVSITIVNTTPTYTITASAGSNGSISPSGSVAVNSGANQSFSFTPNAGYEVAGVTVNGVSQGVLTSYTFSNVTANQSISVSFKQSTTPVGDFVSITSPSNGATFTFGTPVTVNATGVDAQGIETMRFRVDGGTFYNDDIAPYTYTFSNLSVGEHTLEVQMKDNLVNRIMSSPVKIIIVASSSRIGIKSNPTATEAVQGITIYPNPTTGLLHLDFANSDQNKEIKVFSILGQLVHSIQTKNSSVNLNLQELNLKGLAILEVKDGNTVTSHKVIIK
jgi:Divergent InlB B-repeat domain/Bacterial Ig domain/Domain of unknown function (DUF5060)/Secretion system C-terminal sorting domain/Carbohydrate binding domain